MQLKNSKAQKAVDETMGTISAALAILDKLGDADDANFSAHVSLSPFDLIMEILYRTVGYDKIVEFVSKIISWSIPEIEVAVKTYMLTQLKLMFTCSVNPFITYDLLKEGVVFDLKTIDLMNILYYSPLDKSIDAKTKNGKFYYFGCEDFDFPDQLEKATDFNALLWYMKNRTVGTRTVWYGYKKQPEKGGSPSLYQKQKRTDGILTLEYSGRPNGLKDAEGNGMPLQTPFNNCLHVFIGNTKPIDPIDTETVGEQLMETKTEQAKFTQVKAETLDFKERLTKLLEVAKEDNDKSSTPLSKKEFKEANNETYTYIEYMNKILKCLDKHRVMADELSRLTETSIIVFNIETNSYNLFVPQLQDTLVIEKQVFEGNEGSLIEEKKALYDDLITHQVGDDYRPVRYNYYYMRTLFEFNTEYLFSLKLFDEKTLAANLLDALCGCLTMDVDLSFQERFIQNEVRRMVQDIVESDDTVVNDCFFTFDNAAYDELMERSQLQRMGFYVSPNGAVGAQLNAEDIMAALNSLSDTASKEEIESAIESSLFELSRQISPEYLSDSVVNPNLQMNLIDNLLNTLAYVIVLSVLSPKLYLLMAVNLKIMGRESNFDLRGFIESFRQMIVGIIKTIRDELMRRLQEWVMELVGKLAKEVGAKLALEQILYYRQLLEKCIACFRKGQTLTWNMADVDYADIYSTETGEPTDNEC